jgi:hypothetical protein
MVPFLSEQQIAARFINKTQKNTHGRFLTCGCWIGLRHAAPLKILVATLALDVFAISSQSTARSRQWAERWSLSPSNVQPLFMRNGFLFTNGARKASKRGGGQ